MWLESAEELGAKVVFRNTAALQDALESAQRQRLAFVPTLRRYFHVENLLVAARLNRRRLKGKSYGLLSIFQGFLFGITGTAAPW